MLAAEENISERLILHVFVYYYTHWLYKVFEFPTLHKFHRHPCAHERTGVQLRSEGMNCGALQSLGARTVEECSQSWLPRVS